jgi:hypothetical protein
MFKLIAQFLKKFKKTVYITPPFYPFTKLRPIFKRKRYKELKPEFPSQFVYNIDWYKDWDKRLIEDGWTKKELKQGWRWVK